jgi:hypothetical protein
MHWTAATGTMYTPVRGAADPRSGKWTVIVVAVIVLPPSAVGSNVSLF